MTQPVFSDSDSAAYPFRFRATLTMDSIAGGIPTDPRVAEGWLKTKLGIDDDEEIRRLVAQAMIERGLRSEDEEPDDALDAAVAEVVADRHLNGFKRDDHGLYIERRGVKAMVKEASNIRWPYPQKKWGPSRKSSKAFFAEHVFIDEPRIYLGRTEADEVVQRFVHTHRGNGIQYEEVCYGCDLTFTVVTDHDFSDKEWGLFWQTAQRNGLGASRSQDFGTFTVTEWKRVGAKSKRGKTDDEDEG